MKNVQFEVCVPTAVADAVNAILNAADRATRLEEILRRIVGEWDEAGMIDGEAIEEARERLRMATPLQSPITDAAIDAAITEAQ